MTDARVDVEGLTNSSLVNTSNFFIPHVVVGGIFAQPSSVGQPGNIGRHVQDHFAAVFDQTATVSYHPTSWLRLFAGYNYLYLSTAAQAGDQINRNVNFTLTGLAANLRTQGFGPGIIGPPAPAFTFHDSSFWCKASLSASKSAINTATKSVR